MKAVVAHDIWDRGGGGELFNAYVVKTLLENGFDVAIVALARFDVGRFREMFGVDLSNVRIFTLFSRPLPFLGLYQKLGFFIPLSRAVKKLRPDFIFVDRDVYKPVAKLRSKLGFKIFEYIHFPYRWGFERRRDLPGEYVEVLRNYFRDAEDRYGKGLWRYYYKVFLWLYNKVARYNPLESADVVLANSRFTARLVKLLWGGKPVVLYPPVLVKDFTSDAKAPFDSRDDAVVMVGRISSEKRYEEAIDAIAMTSSRPVLRIVGSLNPRFEWYKELLVRRAREKGVKLELYINASRKELVKIVTRSKIFVHTTRYEQFGIAVVEAMAGGCPVIVHGSGGPYEDVIERGEYGLYYNGLDDLAEKVDKSLSDRGIWEYYHRKSLMRASQFGEEVFSRRLLEIINRYA
jgi:glycosyltransferase involved in cell wall biosynthesis